MKRTFSLFRFVFCLTSFFISYFIVYNVLKIAGVSSSTLWTLYGFALFTLPILIISLLIFLPFSVLVRTIIYSIIMIGVVWFGLSSSYLLPWMTILPQGAAIIISLIGVWITGFIERLSKSSDNAEL